MGLFDILFNFKKNTEEGTGEKITNVRMNAGAMLEDLAKAGGLSKEERSALLGSKPPSAKRVNVRVQR